MRWGLDAMLVAHGSLWDLEVILAFKSTFPVRTLLVPSFPQGGMLTWDLLGKKGNGAIGVSLENFYVKKVGFLFCRTSQNQVAGKSHLHSALLPLGRCT